MRTTNTVTYDEKYTYDVWDRRISDTVTTNGVTTSQIGTVYDGDNPYADYNAASMTWTRYLYGDAVDELFARYTASGELDWYLTDRQGSVYEIVSGSGTAVYTAGYDAFGNKVVDGGSGSDRFLYTGPEWDSQIGQYYYRARYYSPTVGRFESEDPLEFAAGDSNFYGYVENSPTNATDPTGWRSPYDIFGPIGEWSARDKELSRSAT